MRTFFFALMVSLLSLSAQAQLFGGIIPMNKFEAGYYYDLTGKKINGKIAKDAGNKNVFASSNYILFKSDTASGKVRISPEMMKSFVVLTDSFTVSHGEDAEFYKVELEGPVSIYSSSDFNSSPGMMMPAAGGGMSMTTGTVRKTTTYFFGPDPDHLTALDRKNYTEKLAGILADQPEISDKILKKKYRFGDLKKLFADYKKAKMKAAN